MDEDNKKPDKKIELRDTAELNESVNVFLVIGREEVNHLLEKEEYSAALLVTAVDLEFVLAKHLEEYFKRNKNVIKNNNLRSWLGKAKTENDGSLDLYIRTFEKIYNSNSLPGLNSVPKIDWKNESEMLKDLKNYRNDVAHKRGVFKEIRTLQHDIFSPEKKVKELIDSVYDFCEEHPPSPR